MKEQTIEHFFKNKLYYLLQQASADQVAELSRCLRLSPFEVDTLKTLAREVKRGVSEAIFLDTLAALRKNKNDNTVLSFQAPSAEEQQENQDNFNEMVRGKAVALVGPADDNSKARGRIIDAHDLVVRINFQFPVAQDLVPSIGCRTDILYHCCNGDYAVDEILNRQFSELTHVCFQRNIDSRKLRAFAKENHVPTLDISSLYEELEKQLKTPPTTGTVALYHLLHTPLKSLSLFGFSLFQTPYHRTYRGDGNKKRDVTSATTHVGPHRVEPHVNFWQELLRENERVTLEPLLVEILRR